MFAQTLQSRKLLISGTDLTTLTNEVLFAEMYYSKKIIKQVIGVSTRCMRSPYGQFAVLIHKLSSD